MSGNERGVIAVVVAILAIGGVATLRSQIHYDSPFEAFRPPVAWTATPYGFSYTSAINFSFSRSVPGLNAGQIVLAEGTGAATMGDFVVNGDTRFLTVAAERAGTVYVYIDNPRVESGVKAVDINLVGWVVAADSAMDTTAISFAFDAPISGLAETDIIVEAGTGNVERKALTGGGASWTLPVTVTSFGEGDISVSVNRPGIKGGTETLRVARPPVDWTATAVGTPYTTAIDFEFAGPVPGLAARHIIVDDGTGSARRGWLAGNATARSLSIGVERAGNVYVSIDKPGFVNSAQPLELNVVAWTANIYGTPYTTAIDFELSEPVELNQNNIAVAGAASQVALGDLTGHGTSWRIPVANPGFEYLDVAIVRRGIERGLERLRVNLPLVGAVSAGDMHTAAIKTDGSLWTWGENSAGQLGVGDTAPRNLPVRVESELGWAVVSAGIFHTAAIREDGSLWAWGRNDNGQLGDGTTAARHAPVRIGDGYDWVYVSAGGFHTAAIESGGKLWTWGRNANGQLGDGTTIDRLSPRQIGADASWSSVSAGRFHTAAIETGGGLWAWGRNNEGQLGNGISGNLNNIASPVQTNEGPWSSVSAGGLHTVALREDGTLWAWGHNMDGQLGDGTTTASPIPVQVGEAASWVSVSAGNRHTVAVREDGTFWAWGNNGFGRLGNGTSANSSAPIQVGEGVGLQTASAGSFHTTAIGEDGALWSWGNNRAGILGIGDGDTSARRTPARVIPMQNAEEQGR